MSIFIYDLIIRFSTPEKPKIFLNREHDHRFSKSFDLSFPDKHRNSYSNFIAASDGSLYSATFYRDFQEWHLCQHHKGCNVSRLVTETHIRVEGFISWVQVGNNVFAWDAALKEDLTKDRVQKPVKVTP